MAARGRFLLTAGTGWILITHWGIRTPPCNLAKMETRIKALVGDGADRVAQQCEGRDGLKHPPKHSSPLSRLRVKLCIFVGLPTSTHGEKMELPSLWWGEKKNQPDLVVLGCEMAMCGLGSLPWARGHAGTHGPLGSGGFPQQGHSVFWPLKKSLTTQSTKK